MTFWILPLSSENKLQGHMAKHVAMFRELFYYTKNKPLHKLLHVLHQQNFFVLTWLESSHHICIMISRTDLYALNVTSLLSTPDGVTVFDLHISIDFCVLNFWTRKFTFAACGGSVECTAKPSIRAIRAWIATAGWFSTSYMECPNYHLFCVI